MSHAGAGVLVGLDVGGTKTHLRVVGAGGDAAGALVDDALVDDVAPSTGWSALPVDDAARWIAQRVRAHVGDHPLVGVGVGAQGCEERTHTDALAARLRALLGAPVAVVNDAELLVPAAGHTVGVGVIVGTGAIAVATTADGGMARAGGWGWVLSDDGSASALVREAARAVLARADRGAEPDELGRLLLASVGVTSVAGLAHALSWDPGVETWGTHARAVTTAADRGSADALDVLDRGADAVADLVRVLHARGVDVRHVVVAGGVATAVPRLFERLRAGVEATVPGARVELLVGPPVHGAVVLARRAATAG